MRDTHQVVTFNQCVWATRPNTRAVVQIRCPDKQCNCFCSSIISETLEKMWINSKSCYVWTTVQAQMNIFCIWFKDEYLNLEFTARVNRRQHSKTEPWGDVEREIQMMQRAMLTDGEGLLNTGPILISDCISSLSSYLKNSLNYTHCVFLCPNVASHLISWSSLWAALASLVFLLVAPFSFTFMLWSFPMLRFPCFISCQALKWLHHYVHATLSLQTVEREMNLHQNMTCFSIANTNQASSYKRSVSLGFSSFSAPQKEKFSEDCHNCFFLGSKTVTIHCVSWESSVSFIYPWCYIPALHFKDWILSFEVNKLVFFNLDPMTRAELLLLCGARMHYYFSKGLFSIFNHCWRQWRSRDLLSETVFIHGSWFDYKYILHHVTDSHKVELSDSCQ